MTKDELDEWIKQSTFIDSTEEYVDEQGNLEGFRIYKKNGLYYRLEFCNDHPCEKWGDKEYMRGAYEPEIVTPVIKKIEITEYVPINVISDAE